ncbi:MAG: hypothetical protein Sylvanvirus3_23 [Sylvanvirus sp.]|uniref:Uncharacterized protein n=1 Tax=Sylvanvirus sp. TaxID=2487774 RepID=A0A3G5AKU4_9VIRU|nr:MAG: hypothetical protein Sylvanvirus3_23 [Sylvanvirus sp.]
MNYNKLWEDQPSFIETQLSLWDVIGAQRMYGVPLKFAIAVDTQEIKEVVDNTLLWRPQLSVNISTE